MRIEKFVGFRILYGIIVLLAISTGTANAAQTLEISVQTDDNNYDEGDTIVISGNVSIVVGSTPITLQLFSEGNLVDIAQIVVAQDGSYSHTVIAEGPQWKKPGDYTVRASYGEGNIAESEFNYSPKSAVTPTTTNFEVDAGSSGTFDVKYTIKGGTVKNMVIDEESFALIVQIESADEGSITLELPREFIGAEKQDGKDDKFIILIDAIEVDYNESVVHTESRTITINFEQGDSDIEIIGTYVIPEFGTIVMTVLIVGIMITILATRNKLQINI
jgi:predicted secreted protein with PEFG-CTERM motif